MKTITRFFSEIIFEEIRKSIWFRTAPIEHQKKAKIKVLGIDNIEYKTLMAGRGDEPAIIAECTCGGETQRFALTFGNTFLIKAIA